MNIRNAFFLSVLIVSIYSCNNKNNYNSKGNERILDCVKKNEKLSHGYCLRSIDFEPLNEFIQYHNLDTNIIKEHDDFYVKNLATYNFFNDTLIIDSASAFQKYSFDTLNIVFLDAWSNSDLGNHLILKVNSKIAYQWNPELLKKYIIQLKNYNKENAKIVTDYLIDNGFSDIRTDSIEDLFNKDKPWSKSLFVYFDQQEITLEYSDSLCNSISKYPLIDTMFYVSFFKGMSEQDWYFEVKNK